MPHQYGMKNFKGTKAQYKKAVAKEKNPLIADLKSQGKGMHQMPNGSTMSNSDPSMMKKGKKNFCPTCGKSMGAPPQYMEEDMGDRNWGGVMNEEHYVPEDNEHHTMPGTVLGVRGERKKKLK